jgi:hypothetical protein
VLHHRTLLHTYGVQFLFYTFSRGRIPWLLTLAPSGAIPRRRHIPLTHNTFHHQHGHTRTHRSAGGRPCAKHSAAVAPKARRSLCGDRHTHEMSVVDRHHRTKTGADSFNSPRRPKTYFITEGSYVPNLLFCCFWILFCFLTYDIVTICFSRACFVALCEIILVR